MSSVFPDNLDSFSVTHADNVNEVILAALANAVGDALNKIERELGVDPKAVWASVAVRLAALEYPPVNSRGASYTLVLTDASRIIEMNVAGANNLTVPPNSSVAFPVGTIIEVFQYGAGQTTIVAGAGVTIRSPGARLKLTGQYSSAALRKRATDEWVLAGDLTT